MEMDVIGGFIANLPGGIIFMFCGSGVMLVFAIIAIVISRRRRAQRAAAAAASTPGYFTGDTSSGAPRSSDPPADSGMMPDLDMLLDVRGMRKETPVSTPAAPTPPQPTPQTAPQSNAQAGMPTAMPPAPPPAARRSSVTRVTLNSGETVDAATVLTALRDVVNGDLLVQLGDSTYSGFADLPDARTRFKKLIAEAGKIAENSDSAADEQTMAPGGTLHLQLADGQQIEAAVVLLLLRDVVDGNLLVQLGETPYRGVANLPNTRARFIKLMRDILALADREGGIVSTTAASSANDSAAGSAANPTLGDLLSTPGAPPMPEDAPKGNLPGDLPNYSAMADDMITMRKRRRDIKPVPELDIAGAIEAYLQHKLSYLPELRARGLHVHPSTDGTVRIEWDGSFYEAVDAIPDGTVRNFLSETIQEWQDRQ